ncbi:MAG: HDOD domain-containing protein [Gemmatimonadales bacterium]
MPHTIEEKAARLEGRIRAIHAHQDFPVLSDQIREVVRVSEDDDSALDRLAGLVIRNYGLTLKVLRTVNSIHYNRSGQTILSVARAVMLLGVRTVREFCASFLLFDHYQKQSAELKELMLLSMLTATQADALAEWAPGAATEEAYVCGMFRNLGEVLIAHHFPEDYLRIREAARERDIPVSEAVGRELGFSYEDLGAAMARYWGMPIVGQAMLPHGTGSSLRAVTEFSHALTDLVYRSPRPPADEAIQALVQRFRREVPVPADRIAKVIDEARAEVRRAFAAAGGAEGDLDLLTPRRGRTAGRRRWPQTDPQASARCAINSLGRSRRPSAGASISTGPSSFCSKRCTAAARSTGCCSASWKPAARNSGPGWPWERARRR